MWKVLENYMLNCWEKKKPGSLSNQQTPTATPTVCTWTRDITKGVSLTCVVLIALSSTGEELCHGGAHCFRCTSQVLSTFFQL